MEVILQLYSYKNIKFQHFIKAPSMFALEVCLPNEVIDTYFSFKEVLWTILVAQKKWSYIELKLEL